MNVLVLHDLEEEAPPADGVVGDVVAALRAAGHQATASPLLADVPVAAAALRRATPDLVFNLTESFAGRSALDSSVASLLNLLDLRYTGSSHAGLMLAGDKALAKKVLTFHGIRTPEFATLHRGALESGGELSFPLIVKPPQEDASIGITSASVVRDLKELLEQIDSIHRQYRSPVLVEQFIEGREFYVGVLGNESAAALPAAELEMSGYPEGVPRVASWEAKWETDHDEFRGSHVVFADDLPSDVVERMAWTAVQAFHALRLRDYARVDLRLDAAGEAWVIEVNPNCYLRRGEVFAESARRAGLEYDALVARIVELASARYVR